MHRAWLLFALFLAPVGFSQGYAARFDTAWRLVAERYWDLSRLPIDWEAMKLEYRPQAEAAESDAQFYAVLEAMYQRIGDDHSVFVPPEKVSEIRASYGDLPCLGLFGLADPAGAFQLGKLRAELLQDEAPALGYVALPDLATSNVAGRLREAVTRLERDGAKGLILDLRGNPGGRLVEMMQAAGVFTSGFLWRTVTNWALPLPYPALGSPATELPLAVLIDGEVNSAAEGLAGALQRKGRAVIVGERSAGNVEAVLPFCLRDGSQAWLATGVLAPIGAPTWEGRGVLPDLPTAPEAALEAAASYLREQLGR